MFADGRCDHQRPESDHGRSMDAFAGDRWWSQLTHFNTRLKDCRNPCYFKSFRRRRNGGRAVIHRIVWLLRLTHSEVCFSKTAVKSS